MRAGLQFCRPFHSSRFSFRLPYHRRLLDAFYITQAIVSRWAEMTLRRLPIEGFRHFHQLAALHLTPRIQRSRSMSTRPIRADRKHQRCNT
jgi:hypothetical protein